MIYLSIIKDFLMIGMLSFGGGYTTIPMVKDIVEKYEVLNMEMLENFIAISESTPGPIAINLATFVGNEIGGLIGGVSATIFEVLPAFIIILVFVKFFKKYIDNENVKFALSIIRPCIVGIIMAVGVGMFASNIFPYIGEYIKIINNIEVKNHFVDVAELIDSNMYLEQIDKMNIELVEYRLAIIKCMIIAIFVVFAMFMYKKILKKKLSSIKTIVLGAILGIAINYIL